MIAAASNLSWRQERKTTPCKTWIFIYGLVFLKILNVFLFVSVINMINPILARSINIYGTTPINNAFINDIDKYIIINIVPDI